MGIFDGIDFNNLPENFKEDSVREEIIAPLLKVLGYSAFDEKNLIIRSPSLQHPFVQFGTKSVKIKEIPDYLIQVNKKMLLLLRQNLHQRTFAMVNMLNKRIVTQLIETYK